MMSGRFTEPAALMETLSLGLDLFTLRALASQSAFAGFGQHLNEEFSLDGQWQSIEDVGQRLGQEIFERRL